MSGPEGGQREGPSTATSKEESAEKKFWEFADLGFDTAKKLWFIQFYNGNNEGVGTYFARSLSLTGGAAAQYQWKDAEGRPFWHVRERFFAAEIEKFTIDPTGTSIKLSFRDEQPGEEGGAPAEFAYLLYAFHLSSKDGGRAPLGFVEFHGSDGGLIRRIDNKWIMLEGAKRTTFGEYPSIRMRVEGTDVGRVLVTKTAVIIQGKSPP